MDSIALVALVRNHLQLKSISSLNLNLSQANLQRTDNFFPEVDMERDVRISHFHTTHLHPQRVLFPNFLGIHDVSDDGLILSVTSCKYERF